MKINEDCKLILRDVYLYDISQCHYQIMQRLGFDTSNIPVDDKLERNKAIGMMMRDNPRITSIIRDTTNSLISEYITRNNINEDEIILRQYDGLIVTKLMRNTTDRYLPLDLREQYEVMVISIDRNKYLAHNGREVTIKGVPYRYEAMDKMLEKLCRINFMSKKSVFTSMQNIKDEIMESDDAYLFCIPESDSEFMVFMKRYGQVKISRSMAGVMDTDDIDKRKYFDFYLRPFTESITIEFIGV